MSQARQIITKFRFGKRIYFLVFPCMTAHFKEPLLIEKGEMQYLFDHNGKKYLDLFGGIVTVSVGHCHPRVNQALIDQAQKLWHTTQIYWYEGIHKYAKQLADTLPEGLDQGEINMAPTGRLPTLTTQP